MTKNALSDTQRQQIILEQLDALLHVEGDLLKPQAANKNTPAHTALMGWLDLETNFPDILAQDPQGFGVLFINKIIALYQKQLEKAIKEPYKPYYFPVLGFYFENDHRRHSAERSNYHNYKTQESKTQYEVLNHISQEQLKFLLENNNFLVPSNVIRHSTVFAFLKWESISPELFNGCSHKFLIDALKFLSKTTTKDKATLLHFLKIQENIQDTLLVRIQAKRMVLDNNAVELQYFLSDKIKKEKLKEENYLQDIYQLASQYKSWECLELLSEQYTLYKNIPVERTIGSLANYILSPETDNPNNEADTNISEEQIRQEFFSHLSPQQVDIFKSLFYRHFIDNFLSQPEHSFYNNTSSFATPEFFSYLNLYEQNNNKFSFQEDNAKLQEKISSALLSLAIKPAPQDTNEQDYQEKNSPQTLKNIIGKYKELFPSGMIEDMLQSTGGLGTLLLSQQKNNINLVVLKEICSHFPASTQFLTKINRLKLDLEKIQDDFLYPAQTLLSTALVSHHTLAALFLLDKVSNYEKLTVYNKVENNENKNTTLNIVEFLERFKQPLNVEVLGYFVQKIDYSKLDVMELLSSIAKSQFIEKEKSYSVNGIQQANATLIILEKVLPVMTATQFEEFATNYQNYRNSPKIAAHSSSKSTNFFTNLSTQLKGRGYNMYCQPTHDPKALEELMVKIGILIEQAQLSRSIACVSLAPNTQTAKTFKL